MALWLFVHDWEDLNAQSKTMYIGMSVSLSFAKNLGVGGWYEEVGMGISVNISVHENLRFACICMIVQMLVTIDMLADSTQWKSRLQQLVLLNFVQPHFMSGHWWCWVHCIAWFLCMYCTLCTVKWSVVYCTVWLYGIHGTCCIVFLLFILNGITYSILWQCT